MEGTCHYDKCKFGKDFFGKAEECFNYKQTWWKPLEGEPKLVQDCSPIRTLLMVQELYNRLIGVQQAVEEQRNEANRINSAFSVIVQKAQERALAIQQIEREPYRSKNGPNGRKQKKQIPDHSQ